jgi:phenylacetate-CoA ligase
MNQLYLSSYHLSADTVADYADALTDRSVTHLVGYPSALASLARLLIASGAPPPPGLRVALTNAETLLDGQRAEIAQGLGIPARDMFGQAEIVAAASECAHGTLHQWPEAGSVEVLDDHHDHAAAPGTTGRLVATGLLNDAMALIRYDTGDRLTPPAADRPACPCGRTLPAFGQVEGRRDDVVLTPDGREVGRLDPVFKSDFPIAEAQIVQTSRTELLVRVVALDGFGPDTREQVARRLRERVGDLDITIDEVDRIERTANGKFRAVVSELDQDTRTAPDPRP